MGGVDVYVVGDRATLDDADVVGGTSNTRLPGPPTWGTREDGHVSVLARVRVRHGEGMIGARRVRVWERATVWTVVESEI